MTGASPILEARGLVKRYGRVVALDHADFNLMPNEILGVIGDNGAGKSTLIKALCGAVNPDSGEILLDGQPVHFRSPLDARNARYRDGLPEPRTVAGALDRRQHVPGARDPEAGRHRKMVPPARPLGDAEDGAAEAERTRADDHPEHQSGGGDAVRRPAAGRRRGARRRLRQPRRDHGRADGGARREGSRGKCST